MASPQPRPTRLSVTELPFYVFLVTLGLCLLRAADLPSLDIGVGGTTLSIGPADPALLLTAVLAVRGSSGSGRECPRRGCWPRSPPSPC